MDLLNLKSISRALIYVLIALLPVQLGTFFFLPISYVFGVKTDYLAPAIYLTDIIILLLIVLNFPVLFRKLPIRLILVLSFVSIGILFSIHPFIGMYHLVKLFEVTALFFIVHNIKIEPKKILFIFLGSSMIELILCISQIHLGSSLQGIFYYLGERSFNLSTPTIATVAVNGKELLRPYGTFSHPNSLAGFYLLLYCFILFSTRFTNFTKIKYITMGILSILIFISFSKIAIITYLIITVLYAVRDLKNICWICTIAKIGVALVIVYLFMQVKGDANTINKRIYLTQSSLKIIGSHALIGTGLGNYLYAQSKIPNPYPYHFLEPVHNIFLLAIAELGIPIAIVVFYMLYPALKRFWATPTGKAMILAICCTGMFDHYWLTLQQNILLLPVLFALLKNEGKYDKINGT